jgi:hypothetical protein
LKKLREIVDSIPEPLYQNKKSLVKEVGTIPLSNLTNRAESRKSDNEAFVGAKEIIAGEKFSPDNSQTSDKIWEVGVF